MITREHTPGPWTVLTGVCRNDHPDTSADVLGANGTVVVANCGCHEAAIANAHLIAAAPDLLEAVRAGGRYSDALQRYQAHGVRGQMIPGTDELEHLFKDWHDKGHAAIAKATEEPPSVDAVDPQASDPGKRSTRA
jgi:hypothetical protein